MAERKMSLKQPHLSELIKTKSKVNLELLSRLFKKITKRSSANNAIQAQPLRYQSSGSSVAECRDLSRPRQQVSNGVNSQQVFSVNGVSSSNECQNRDTAFMTKTGYEQVPARPVATQIEKSLEVLKDFYEDIQNKKNKKKKRKSCSSLSTAEFFQGTSVSLPQHAEAIQQQQYQKQQNGPFEHTSQHENVNSSLLVPLQQGKSSDNAVNCNAEPKTAYYSQYEEDSTFQNNEKIHDISQGGATTSMAALEISLQQRLPCKGEYPVSGAVALQANQGLLQREDVVDIDFLRQQYFDLYGLYTNDLLELYNFYARTQYSSVERSAQSIGPQFAPGGNKRQMNLSMPGNATQQTHNSSTFSTCLKSQEVSPKKQRLAGAHTFTNNMERKQDSKSQLRSQKISSEYTSQQACASNVVDRKGKGAIQFVKKQNQSKQVRGGQQKTQCTNGVIYVNEKQQQFNAQNNSTLAQTAQQEQFLRSKSSAHVLATTLHGKFYRQAVNACKIEQANNSNALLLSQQQKSSENAALKNRTVEKKSVAQSKNTYSTQQLRKSKKITKIEENFCNFKKNAQRPLETVPTLSTTTMPNIAMPPDAASCTNYQQYYRTEDGRFAPTLALSALGFGIATTSHYNGSLSNSPLARKKNGSKSQPRITVMKKDERSKSNCVINSNSVIAAGEALLTQAKNAIQKNYENKVLDQSNNNRADKRCKRTNLQLSQEALMTTSQDNEVKGMVHLEAKKFLFQPDTDDRDFSNSCSQHSYDVLQQNQQQNILKAQENTINQNHELITIQEQQSQQNSLVVEIQNSPQANFESIKSQLIFQQDCQLLQKYQFSQAATPQHDLLQICEQFAQHNIQQHKDQILPGESLKIDNQQSSKMQSPPANAQTKLSKSPKTILHTSEIAANNASAAPNQILEQEKIEQFQEVNNQQQVLAVSAPNLADQKNRYAKDNFQSIPLSTKQQSSAKVCAESSDRSYTEAAAEIESLQYQEHLDYNNNCAQQKENIPANTQWQTGFCDPGEDALNSCCSSSISSNADLAPPPPSSTAQTFQQAPSVCVISPRKTGKGFAIQQQQISPQQLLDHQMRCVSLGKHLASAATLSRVPPLQLSKKGLAAGGGLLLTGLQQQSALMRGGKGQSNTQQDDKNSQKELFQKIYQKNMQLNKIKQDINSMIRSNQNSNQKVQAQCENERQTEEQNSNKEYIPLLQLDEKIVIEDAFLDDNAMLFPDGEEQAHFIEGDEAPSPLLFMLESDEKLNVQTEQENRSQLPSINLEQLLSEIDGVKDEQKCSQENPIKETVQQNPSEELKKELEEQRTKLLQMPLTQYDRELLEELQNMYQIVCTQKIQAKHLGVDELEQNAYEALKKKLKKDEKFKKSKFFVAEIPLKKPRVVENVEERNRQEEVLQAVELEKFQRNNELLAQLELMLEVDGDGDGDGVRAQQQQEQDAQKMQQPQQAQNQDGQFTSDTSLQFDAEEFFSELDKNTRPTFDLLQNDFDFFQEQAQIPVLKNTNTKLTIIGDAIQQRQELEKILKIIAFMEAQQGKGETVERKLIDLYARKSALENSIQQETFKLL